MAGAPRRVSLQRGVDRSHRGVGAVHDARRLPQPARHDQGPGRHHPRRRLRLLHRGAGLEEAGSVDM